MNKKAQSAMEYLMTYGWAILVVLIALGALFYLGVFSPKTPNSCVATAPFTCADVKAQDTGASFSQDNVTISVGASGIEGWVTFQDFTITSPQGYTCRTSGISGNGLGMNMQAANLSSSIQKIVCTGAQAGGLAVGNKLQGSASLNYTMTGGSVHTTTISFSGSVE
jgi:hypothetical protein